MPGSNYTYITTAATTVIGPATSAVGPRRINLLGIQINKTLTGNVTVKAGSTTIGILQSNAVPGMHWYPDEGVEVADLQITNASNEDLTVFWNNL